MVAIAVFFICIYGCTYPCNHIVNVYQVRNVLNELHRELHFTQYLSLSCIEIKLHVHVLDSPEQRGKPL